MPRKGHTGEQILQALRQAESWEKVTEIDLPEAGDRRAEVLPHISEMMVA